MLPLSRYSGGGQGWGLSQREYGVSQGLRYAQNPSAPLRYAAA
jgi:hypothetical protein